MKIKADNLNVLEACPAGSIVARDNGVSWRKSSIGDWRAEHGMRDRVTSYDLWVMAESVVGDVWVLRWGWVFA